MIKRDPAGSLPRPQRGMRRRHGMGATLLVVTLLALGLQSKGAASAPPAPSHARPCVIAKPGEKLWMDFRDVELRLLGRYVSCALGLSLLYSPADLKSRRVTVFSPAPLPASALLSVFESGLRAHGLTLERRGAIHVIRALDQVPSKRRSSRGR